MEFDGLTATEITAMAVYAEQRAAASTGHVAKDYAREARKCRKAADKAITIAKIRSEGMPMYCAASGSCEMARIAAPSRVCWMNSHSAPIHAPLPLRA